MEEKNSITPKRGVGLRVFGSILFFLGVINLMFLIKAGLEMQTFYIVMVAAGIIIFLIGVLKAKKS